MTNSDNGLRADAGDPARDRGRVLLGGIPDRADRSPRSSRPRSCRSTRALPPGRETRSSSSSRRRAGFEVQVPLERDLHARAGLASGLRPARQRRPVTPSAAGRTAERELLIVDEESTVETAPRVDKNTRVPVEDLEAGHIDAAVAGYKKLQAANPSDPGLAETRFNQLGYGFLQKKDYREGDRDFPPEHGALSRLRQHRTTVSGRRSKASGDKAGADRRCTRRASRSRRSPARWPSARTPRPKRTRKRGSRRSARTNRRLHLRGDLPLASSFGRRLLLRGVCLRWADRAPGRGSLRVRTRPRPWSPRCVPAPAARTSSLPPVGRL